MFDRRPCSSSTCVTMRRAVVQDLEILKTKELKNPKKKHGNIPL